MALSTYTELKAAIADWLNRADLTAVIPSFIVLAEAELNRTLRVEDMVEREQTTLSEQYTLLPPGFREMKSLRVLTTPAYPMKNMLPAQEEEFRAKYGTTPGRPLKYKIIGDSFESVPAPNDSYCIEMAVYAAITSLSDDAPTNWLLTKHPDAYLYGALLQAAPYLKDDDRIPVWAGGLDRVKTAIKDENDRMVQSGSSLQQTFSPIG